jgi:hypothetical protein
MYAQSNKKYFLASDLTQKYNPQQGSSIPEISEI